MKDGVNGAFGNAVPPSRLVLMSLLFAAGLAAGAPSKPAPLWGGSRQWTAMGINFTSPEVVTATWVFNMYYDDTIRASRWQHLQGQQDYLCGVGSSAPL